MKKLFISIFISVVVSLLSVTDAAACSCVPSDPGLTVKQQVAAAKMGSEAVFSARIVAVKRDDPARQQVTYEVEVLRVWRGRVAKFAAVSTGSNSAMCGYGFVVGETYLIYAGGDESRGFSTTHCTRTARLSDTADSRHLGIGRRPRAGRRKI